MQQYRTFVCSPVSCYLKRVEDKAGFEAGQRRLAIMGEAPNSLMLRIEQAVSDNSEFFNDGYDRVHHTWPVDGGKMWHDGMPLAFDGNELLL